MTKISTKYYIEQVENEYQHCYRLCSTDGHFVLYVCDSYQELCALCFHIGINHKDVTLICDDTKTATSTSENKPKSKDARIWKD